MFDPEKPHNSLPPIPERTRLETPAVLRQALDASRVLAELKASGGLIPNQVVLLKAMLLQEARASSQIENVVTTNDKLYRALGETRESDDIHTREVRRYGEAVFDGYEKIKQGRPITPSFICDIVEVVKNTNVGVRTGEDCRIVNDVTGKVVYTPPSGKGRILALLSQLCEYLYASDGTDPLVKMAAAHYQFEAIHPFPDGNGRTGRVLNILYLVDAGLLGLPVLFLSHHILRTKPDYYSRLLAVTTEGKWEEWILYLLEAVEITAALTLTRLRNVRDELEGAAARARVEMDFGYSRELIEIVFSQPFTRIAHIVDRKVATRNSAAKYLNELERIGILRSIKVGRAKLYFNQALYDALILE